MPRESPLRFYPKFLTELIAKQIRWISLYTQIYRIYQKIKRDPARLDYMDLALTPVADDEFETRELFQSAGAQAYLVRAQRAGTLRRGTAA